MAETTTSPLPVLPIEISTESYPLPPPNASHEAARLDIQHSLSLADLHGELLLSPLPFPPNQHPLKVADIGAGTGVWAVDLARRNPSYHITAVDLAIPPSFHSLNSDTPPNVVFRVQDVQRPWDFYSGEKFDLIHGRQILLNLPDPKKALERVYENLKPGGFVEFREFWCPLKSEIGNNSSLLCEWHQGTVDAARVLGCDHEYAEKLPEVMKEVGFEELKVSDRIVPLGGWVPGDGLEDEKQRVRREKMDELVKQLIRFGAAGMTRAMHVKCLGWDEEMAREYVERVVGELDREDLGDDRIYARFRIVYGRKPAEK
ncbi:S-adenosyl-L-methionine-dependent methyltransferase [Podospora fimiseda]|uniref:S-adenosyl-L-methionine-dependent methyltransferase n=1 Tax=Podospora fimiseda TaxID=252190 RepID=A0AAN7BTQ9_9PEZI|nr:S-adenosyl-L-methionine-dependent methyltransferase [Podospora fimiseda]